VTREEIILSFFDKSTSLGLEIGPSHNPIAPKRDGYQVEIVDRLDREGLIEHYSKRAHEVDVSLIEEVDYVSNGESLAELTGKENHYDWIISSHSVEHMPDMVSFLRDCERMLKDDGVLILAVPDKRFCFDHFRPLTSLTQLIDAYHEKRQKHSAGAIADYCLNVVRRGGVIGWSPHDGGDYESVHTTDVALERMNNVLDTGRYYDIHAWCFVPSSFRLMMNDLHELGYLGLKEKQHINAGWPEFFMVLSTSGEGMTESRLDVMKAVELELGMAEGIPIKKLSLLTRVFNRFKRLAGKN